MRNLALPPGEPIDYLDAIVESKYGPRKPRLKSLRPKVVVRYTEYWTNRHALNTLSQATYEAEEKEDLQHCYGSRTDALDDLKSKIRKAQDAISRAICPHCGINNPRTFDHYLPEDTFPEYAVLAWNLFPMCDECNNTKLDKLGDSSSENPILNLYFDPLPQAERWLHATIDMSTGVPVASFSLVQTPTMDPDQFARIETHYNTLGLCDRYADRAVEIFSEATASTSAGLTLQELQDTLTSSARSYEKRHGLNYWKVVALDAMAGSQQYLKLVCESHAQ